MAIGHMMLVAAAMSGAALVQPRLEPVHGPRADDDTPRREACSQDRRLCAQLTRQGDIGPWRLKVGERELSIASMEGGDLLEGEQLSLWGEMIVSPGGNAMIGVQRMRRTGYSGGGSSVTTLTLVEVPARGRPLRAVVDLPLSGGAMLRACFNERDQRRRRGACHDEYGFEGTLRLGRHVPGAPPVLILTTKAQTSPGRQSRFEEDRRPVPRGQPRVWRDPVCSYRRTFTFDAASGRYRPDRPLPACRDYLEL